MQLFSSPDSPDLDTFADLVARLGGADAIDALARRHGAFHRARHIKSAADLLRLILAYAPGGRSLRKLAAEAAAVGFIDVSDVALLVRFRRCGDWLPPLCETCCRAAINRRARRRAETRSASSTVRASRDPARPAFVCIYATMSKISGSPISPLPRSTKAKRWIACGSDRATSPSPIAVIPSPTACAPPATPAPICSFV